MWTIIGLSIVILCCIYSFITQATWGFAMIATIIGTIFVSSLTMGFGDWVITSVLAKILPIPASVISIIKNSGFVAKLIAKRAPGVGTGVSIAEAGIVFPVNLFLLWLLNFLILQVSIIIKCRKINGKTLRESGSSALAGAIPASILVLVWGILAAIPIIIGQVLTAIESALSMFIYVPTLLMLIFNIAFGAIGIGVATSKGCAPDAPPPEEKKEESFANANVHQSHDFQCSHTHSHAGYGPYDRCRCMCCPICNAKPIRVQ
jgi:hypothetical protein